MSTSKRSTKKWLIALAAVLAAGISIAAPAALPLVAPLMGVVDLLLAGQPKEGVRVTKRSESSSSNRESTLSGSQSE